VTHPGTTIELVQLKRLYHDQCPRSTEVFIQKLIEHFILVFLDEDCPKAEVIDLGQRHNINEIFEKDYKASASSHSFKIDTYLFTLHGFELPTSRATKHKLIYAADQRSVLSDRLADYLPNLKSRLEDEDGKPFFYVGIIQSPYLTEHVNTNRTDFEFGDPDDAELELPLAEHQHSLGRVNNEVDDCYSRSSWLRVGDGYGIWRPHSAWPARRCAASSKGTILKFKRD
jgi:hypothetical protein